MPPKFQTAFSGKRQSIKYLMRFFSLTGKKTLWGKGENQDFLLFPLCFQKPFLFFFEKRHFVLKGSLINEL